jgi:periplasmic copper chaperone A
MSRFSLNGIAFVMLVLLSSSAAMAGTAIKVEKAWSRATAPGTEIGVGYLTIKNDGDAPDRLVSVTTPAAEKTEIHQTQMQDGKMQMRPVPEGIPIPPNGTVTLEPAGYHLMLIGLKAPLEKGSTFAASLAFEHAGAIDVTFHVEGMGASAPSQD